MILETIPRLSLIVAMAENCAIGVANRLPWHLPVDLKYFRALTMGHPIIMGRKTFDSIGRVLPGRRNIVVTRNRKYARDGAEIVHSLDEALARCTGENEAFVIGGAELFKDAACRADRLYLTLVRTVVAGDVFFTEFSASQWQEGSRITHPADTRNAFACDFIVYDRKIVY